MSDARYFRISPKFWSDPMVLAWTEDARTLALYLLTCSHRNTEGLFRLPKLYALADLGWDPERYDEPFAQLVADGFIDHDSRAEVVMIVKALSWQAPENPNQAKAAARRLAELPRTHLEKRFRDACERYAERLHEALPEGFGEGLAEVSPEPLAPSTSSSTSTSEPLVGTADAAADEMFEEFWDAYPRHHTSKLKGGGGTKGDAKAKWRRLKPAERDEVMQAVRPYAALCAPGGQLPKHAERFLTNERWKTYLDLPNPADDDEFVGGVRRVR